MILLYKKIGDCLERRDSEELLVQLELEVGFESVALKDLKALLERLENGALVALANRGLQVHRVEGVQEVYKVLKD